jgi:hypothetical protein
MGDKASDEDQMERLVVALCERLAEVLPQNQFEVTVEHRHAIRIRGVGTRLGNTAWLSPITLWREPLPVEQRLQLFLDGASQRVQKFVGRRYRPWPTRTASPKVSIEEDRILVWWGGVGEADAVVALRPISLREIRCIDAS